MSIFDVCPQILHRFLRGFPGKAVRVVDVPQSRHIVAFRTVQQIPQTGGISVNAVCFHQQGDAGLFRMGNQFL